MLTELEFNNNRALSSRYNGYDDYLNQMNTTQGNNTQDGNEFNFMDYLPFGDKSITGLVMKGIGNLVPERDPRQTALNEFYDVNNGTIQSGLMAGYNPVSGGFLNTVTGGKFGDPTNYGLQDAYQKRMDTINKTLQRKYSKRNYGDTQLDERLKTLRGMRDDEQKFVADQIGQNYTGDQDMQNVVDDTGRRDATAGAGITAQDQFSNKTGRGRTDYFFGGRARLQGGGMSQGNEENQKQSAEMGNTTVSNNNDSGNDNPPNFFVEDKTSIVDTSGLKSKSPEININYTDPKNYASLKSRVYNTNILKNDDLNVDGTLSGEIGPVSYNTNFTDQGITNTNLTAGNFNADIDANKNYSIGYANNYNGIDYGTTYDSDGNLMFNAGVKFKNGGLAGIL